MQTITAIFEDGVLKPIQPLDLPAQAQVRITIEILPDSPLTIGKLNAFLLSLPALGEDIERNRTFFVPVLTSWRAVPLP
jgi:predicted DNA-binding antitoxin AbrB/MazE fold protein